MRLFEIESSIYAKDYEKHKKWIQIGQRVANATEIGSGVDWKGKDDLWNKASALGNALTHLGQGKVQSYHDAFELAGITDQAEWNEIVELVKTAKKADFDAGDDEVEEGSIKYMHKRSKEGASHKEIGKELNMSPDEVRQAMTKTTEDMNAILASAGTKKHGDKYMNAARKKAQDKGAPLSSKERNDLRDKHSKNRKDKK